ncbi:unnamed protein product [Diatraea saccharalis]|uniref:Uncharacterized protein n=1 Tax=Diatraea saccharalis TaxID=40085 RepID=A0A9N9R2K4_9NEOP|nr:unnamed protein product [Diatraea saccharalis]
MILFCVAVASTTAEPDPKKYKSEVKDKEKLANTRLTDEERTFLREVEAKFGIKSEVPLEEAKSDDDEKNNGTSTSKTPFPAVIAIEIVNDTDTSAKGKRTIDANLGYGYRTNKGYTYTYFGKQPQDKGKFMIYPYSQEDIPPSHSTTYNSDYSQSGKYTTASSQVEIQPSRAYELVDVKEEHNSYQNSRPNSNYENIRGLVSPPPSYSSSPLHHETSHNANPTFYTTYNGQKFSGLSGQFPMVMSNYLVEPSQLLKNPQYQSAGLNQEYLQNHGSHLEQRIVPVLVLRVPSSYLKKPTAELYSGANNYPVSNYLNNVNLQEIVNSYFKKIGYTFAPQVTYQNPTASHPVTTPIASSAHNSGPQNYATTYMHPSYTQSDYSGVQYSAVQPVMAKYPTSYSHQHYYDPMSQLVYQQPEQQYEYTYKYVPQSEGQSQSYYVQPQYQTNEEAATQSNVQSEHSTGEQETTNNSGNEAEYSVPQSVAYESGAPTVEYGTPETQASHIAADQQTEYESSQTVSQEYGTPKEQSIEYTPQKTLSTEYGPAKISLPVYNSPQATRPQYGLPKYTIPKETLAAYQAQLSQSEPKYSYSASNAGAQNYYYPKQVTDEASNNLALSENYPSKDHTLATVLPVSYKHDRKPASVQTISYVTPVPHKYQSPYKIMVPQTFLKNPATEKVSYVNSHSLPYSKSVNQEYNPEVEYTVPSHYNPPVGKQKPPSYPRNYHTHPKRNVKSDSRPENNSTPLKKQSESNDKKKKSN